MSDSPFIMEFEWDPAKDAKNVVKHRKRGTAPNLVRATSAELAGTKDASDWDRVEALTDVDIERAISDDPDAAPILDGAFWRNAEILDPRHEKSTITMRVDEDVLSLGTRRG